MMDSFLISFYYGIEFMLLLSIQDMGFCLSQ